MRAGAPTPAAGAARFPVCLRGSRRWPEDGIGEEIRVSPMQQERRSGHRTHLPGASVVYESARHEPRDADIVDLGAGGLFIPAVAPLPRGTRLALEIRLSRGGPAWPALGRVTWTRTSASPGRPAGMGVKLVDVDDAALEAIQRAIGPAAPARERTVRGIGLTTPPAAWVAKAGAAEAPRTATRRTRTRGRAMAAALLVAAIAAGVLGVMQGRIPWWHGRVAAAGTTPVTSAVVMPALPSVDAPPAAAAPVATAATSAAPPRAPASATMSPSKPTARSPRWRAWAAPPKRSGTVPSDNPY